MMLRFDDLCLLNISCCADCSDDYEEDDSFLRMHIGVYITSVPSHFYMFHAVSRRTLSTACQFRS